MLLQVFRDILGGRLEAALLGIVGKDNNAIAIPSRHRGIEVRDFEQEFSSGSVTVTFSMTP